ncbi:MAG: septum formation inhibitor Maf [Ruminiclostridium sp.]|nr:septum formation inhibitor Maf [Ruminiclostridium sp.]MBQ8411295.1 septum formation inhibitor Maf [Ruminiclostridium sp.]
MLILASKSPRRKELLSLITADFEIIPAVGEENADPSLPPEKFVEALAIAKAQEISDTHPEDTVIGSDTVVAINGEILGKPKDKEDAFRMLSLISGTYHSVFTGVAVIKDGKTYSFTEETKVKFFPLDEFEIERYIATGEPFDKAGAYGIQELGALLVEGIEGDYYNVMGLPVGRLFRLMKELQII